jgi:hypothetical protein
VTTGQVAIAHYVTAVDTQLIEHHLDFGLEGCGNELSRMTAQQFGDGIRYFVARTRLRARREVRG